MALRLLATAVIPDGCADPNAAHPSDPATTGTTGAGAVTTAALGSSGSDDASDGLAATGTTTATPGCSRDADCFGSAPFCAQGHCVACDLLSDGDAACARLDPDRPACAAGRCVVCNATEASRCGADTPVCDLETNTCVCTEHSQCAPRACHLEAQRCMAGEVYEVDGDPGSGASHGSITAALAELAPGDEATLVVHELEAPVVRYDEQFSLPSGVVVALLAAPDEHVMLQGEYGASTIVVPSTSTLYLADFELIVGSVPLEVAGGTAYVSGTRLRGHYDAGVLVHSGGELEMVASESINGDGVGMRLESGGAAEVHRSRFLANMAGGVANDDGRLELVNSVAYGGDNVIAVTRGTADIGYSTLVSRGTDERVLSCGDAQAVVLRNSIAVDVYSGNLFIGCDASQAEVSHSLLGTAFPGLGNVVHAGPAADLFVSATDERDFSLSGTGRSVAEGVAQWRTGDPDVDIDGDARPHEHGAPDFPGADVP